MYLMRFITKGAEMENLTLYNRFRNVPPEAKKTIGAGRLKGFTDINPMWRIKTLTEAFGPAGMGWYYEITKHWVEDGADGVRMAFVEIALYVKHEGEWSKPIAGTGGSTLIAKEKNGMYNDDEAFKKALTDAIGGACKLLGIGADVYFEKDSSKYDAPIKETNKNTIQQPQPTLIDQSQIIILMSKAKEKGISISKIEEHYKKKLNELTSAEFTHALKKMEL